MNKINILFYTLVFLLSSCNKVGTENEILVGEIKIDLAQYKNSATPDTEQYELSDFSAYLFEEGILTEIIQNIVIDEEGVCQISNAILQNDARLYFLANIDKSIDLPLFTIGTSIENDFLNMETKISHSPEIENPLLMGALVLPLTNNEDCSVTLDNSIARIDLTTMAPNIIIEGITISGVADRAFVYKQTPVKSPNGAIHADITKNYSPGITSKQGVIYLYEQQGGQTISINARVGGIKNILTAKLPSVLNRNHSYNIKISGAGASVEIEVVSNSWEDGEEANTSPDLTNDVKIDLENSIFSYGVSVSKTLDTLFLPYYNSNSKLALAANAELEVFISGNSVNIAPHAPQTKTEYQTNAFDISFEHTTATNSATRYVYLNIRDKENPEFFSNVIVIEIAKNQTEFTGPMADSFVGLNCNFESYIDGDIGTLTVMQGAVVSIEGENQEWFKCELKQGKTTEYAIKAGYRPNDPNATGQEQRLTIVVTHGTGDNSLEERYQVSRKNFGLPVELINDTYWCKFNLKGNAISFADQVQINEPVAQVEDLYTYLKTCTDVEYTAIMGDAYKGINHTGLKFGRNTDIVGVGFSFVDYSTTNSNGNITSADPTKQCPSGYQIPSEIDYINVLGNKGISFSAEQEKPVFSDGRTFYKYVRSNIQYDGGSIESLCLNKIESEGNPNFVLMGFGHQHSNTDMVTSLSVLATHGTTNISYDFGRFIDDAKHNSNTTRVIRCIKTPGAFIIKE